MGATPLVTLARAAYARTTHNLKPMPLSGFAIVPSVTASKQTGGVTNDRQSTSNLQAVYGMGRPDLGVLVRFQLNFGRDKIEP